MASFRKRGKVWQAQIRRRGYPNLTATFAAKADAQRWARNEEQRLDRGDCPTTIGQLSDVTVGDLLVRYETEISAKKRGADREGYKIRVLLRSPMAKASLSNVTAAMIAAHRDRRLMGVKPATVRRELALLRHCFEIARREWGHPLRNPFRDVKLPPPANARERRLEPSDIHALQKALKWSRAWYLGPLIDLAVETGMRRGELLGLVWRNIDAEKRIATLPITKNGRSRKVPLTGRAVQILKGLPVTDERVFPVTTGSLRQAWDRLLNKAQIKDLRFHDLRHEAISRFFEMGLSLPEVALISGHRDYKMLFRYTHIRAEDVAKKLHG